MKSITCCLIARDEAHNLPRLLGSLKGIAEEIVVVDSGSRDATQEIAGSHGARVVSMEWLGYGAQKNAAIALATHPWVLSLDADEALSPELHAALDQWKKSPDEPEVNGYRIHRLAQYLGKWVRHGDWYPDILVRLFRKGCARFSENRVHERLIVDGSLGDLDGEILHFTYTGREHRRAKMEQYAKLWAAEAAEKGRKAGAAEAFTHATMAFVRGFLIRRGFLDGGIGWEVAMGNAAATFAKYKELRRLASNPSSSL